MLRERESTDSFHGLWGVQVDPHTTPHPPSLHSLPQRTGWPLYFWSCSQVWDYLRFKRRPKIKLNICNLRKLNYSLESSKLANIVEYLILACWNLETLTMIICCNNTSLLPSINRILVSNTLIFIYTFKLSLIYILSRYKVLPLNGKMKCICILHIFSFL